MFKSKSVAVALSFLVLISPLASCVSMSPSEQQEWNRLRQDNIMPTEHKSPAGAGLLNLLPGIGNFYIASNTEERAQIGVGIANLLLWPLSIVWGLPQAIIDADTYNKKMTARASLEKKGTSAHEILSR